MRYIENRLVAKITPRNRVEKSVAEYTTLLRGLLFLFLFTKCLILAGFESYALPYLYFMGGSFIIII